MLCTLQYLNSLWIMLPHNSIYCLIVSEYVGTVDDDMRYSSGARFSMKDHENDTSCKLQCAVVRGGPWWHCHCTPANLNGQYYTTPLKGSNVIFWIIWHHVASLKKVDMKIQRKNSEPSNLLLHYSLHVLARIYNVRTMNSVVVMFLICWTQNLIRLLKSRVD